MQSPEFPQRKVLLTNEEIQGIVSRLAQEIAQDFKELPPEQQQQCLLLVSVLESARTFTDELRLALYEQGVSTQVLTLQAKSYGAQTRSSGKVEFRFGFKLSDLENQSVLVVEDMIDTGLTLAKLLVILNKSKPSSLHTVVLLKKLVEEIQHVIPGKVYEGIVIPDFWVDGYGIDTAGENRERKDIEAVLLTEQDLKAYKQYLKDKKELLGIAQTA